MAHRRVVVLIGSAMVMLFACSGTAPNSGNTGGSSSSVIGGSSGALASGGVTSSGGGTVSSSANTAAGAGGDHTGGATSAAIGGVPSSGGAGGVGVGGIGANVGSSNRPASGGSAATGGAATGGNLATGGKVSTGGNPATGGGFITGGKTSTAGNGATGGSTGTGGSSGGASSCMSGSFLGSLGKASPLIGASMEDATANSAPFDGRYLYLSGGFFDGTDPCASCASGCATNGDSCANSGSGCAWWGCWQWDQDPPGQYVVSFVATTNAATYNGQARPQIPFFTYYEVLQASGASEGGAEVTALQDPTLLHKYFADFRLMLQRLGTAKAIVHLEPDFWGYVEQAGSNPHTMPAPVTTANPTDCGSTENSIAGFARCLIAMTRKYAANARVGLHASGWGTKMDVLQNTDPKFDVIAEGRKLGSYLLELGAGDGDFIVADMSDRDAGYYQQQGRNTFWDATNATLPNFRQAFTWAKSVSDTVGKPIIWWQIPVGNMSQNNTTNHYQDNRVDYLLTHMSEVVAANGAGLFFGGGDGQQTVPETDDGNLIARVKANAANPVAACP